MTIASEKHSEFERGAAVVRSVRPTATPFLAPTAAPDLREGGFSTKLVQTSDGLKARWRTLQREINAVVATHTVANWIATPLFLVSHIPGAVDELSLAISGLPDGAVAQFEYGPDYTLVIRTLWGRPLGAAARL